MSKQDSDFDDILDNFGEEEEINRKLKEVGLFDHRETKQGRRNLYNVLMQSQEEAKAASLLANKSNEPNKKNQKVENPVDSFKSKSKEQPEVKSQSSKKKETNSAAQRQKKSHSEEKMKNQQLKASESVFQNDFNIVYVEEEGEIIEEEASASPNVAQRSTSKTQPDWKALVTSPDSEEEFTLDSGLGEKLKTTISMKRETSRTPSPGGKRPNILQKAKTPASSTSKNESRLPPNSYAAKLLNASANSGKKESEKQMTFDDIVKCARPPSREKATEDGEASFNVRERPAAKTYDFDEDKDGLRSNSPTPNRFPSFSNKLLNNPKPMAQMRMRQQKLSKEIELMSNHVVTEWSEPINFDYTQVLEELLQKEKDQNKATAEQVRLNARVQWKRPIPLTSFKNIKKLANITANSSISPTPRLDYSPKAGRASDSRSPYQNRDSDDRDIIAVPDESGRNSSHDIFDDAVTNINADCPCPICGKSFSSKDIEMHAAGCQNFDDVDVLQELDRPNSRSGTRSTRLRRGPGDGGTKARTGVTPSTDDEAEKIDSDSEFEMTGGSGSKRNRKRAATADKRRRL